MATRTKTKAAAPTKIDLACGKNKREGFYGVDLWAPEADMRMDVLEYPWPWADGSVEEFHASHFVEHIPMGGVDDGLVAFMTEAHRCLRKQVGEPGDDDFVAGGTITIIHPHGMSSRALQDPWHRRFIVPETWTLYFGGHYIPNVGDWLELNGLGHYPLPRFEVKSVTAGTMPPGFTTRATEVQQHWMTHYWNVYGDVCAVLTAR